jgi:hypothetical protein
MTEVERLRAEVQRLTDLLNRQEKVIAGLRYLMESEAIARVIQQSRCDDND